MKMCVKVFRATLLALLALTLMGGTVLAAFSYYANIQVQETSGNPYDYLPIIAAVDNDYLADNGYIGITGLDTRVLSGSTPLKHLVADDKVLFVSPLVGSNSTGNYKYTLGNTEDLDSFPVVVGYDGYLTVPSGIGDDMQLGDDFEIEFDGYVDTDSGSDKNLVYKEDAFRAWVSDSEEISTSISISSGIFSSTSDGQISKTNDGSYNPAWVSVSGTVNDDATTIKVGQNLDGTDYIVYRGFLFFDTSAIRDDAVITGATLRLYGSTDASTTEFLITIQSGMPTYPTDPLATTDYNKTYYSGDGGSLTTVGYSTSGYNDITFSEEGLGWIDVEGVTNLCIRSSRDIAGTQPAGPESVTFRSTNQAGTDNDPQLVVYYDFSVTVTDISSGVHTVKAYADGTNLGVIVDEGEAGEVSDTTLLSGASVPDNANDITINQNNVLPYFDYYKHTVSDTLIAWYQPICMITGTNLDDREGTDAGETGTAEEDATITWVANPAGVSATIGSLISSSQPEIAPAGEEDILDIVPEGSIPSGGVVDVVALRDNPLYPVVAFATEYLELTEEQIWFGGATLIILIGMGLAVGKVPNHLLLAGTIGLVLSGFFTAQGIYQWWMLLLFVFMFFASLLMERKPVI